MEENIVISVKNVTIRFNKSAEKIDSLREYIVKLVKRQLFFQEFLAVKDVSIDIRRGEAWAIVGKNGSGKSTLLKAICGIVSPYQGTIQVNGRIAPLIELGAGFDGNLTARENIYLNGTILGYTYQFMKEHFNEIVKFAELEEFIDLPLKNFSSGMKSRLGFAIATMVQPDILIVDEVLSVGDFKFKEKCERRIRELLSTGTTILFVSHSLETVKKICRYAIWMEKGEIIETGEVERVCEDYVKRG